MLITGGAGFIGSNLSDYLLFSGNKVVALDNFDEFYPRRIKVKNLEAAAKSENFKLIEGDIRDRGLLSEIFEAENIDVIVHLAAKAGVRPSIDNTEEYYDVNINGTLSILEAMKKKGLKKIVFASSSSVYGNNIKVPFSENDFVDNPISPYAATKKSGELLCHVYSHLYNFDITCLRFFTVFGPRQRPDLAIHKFTKLIDESKPVPFFGDGSTARDYTYVSDIVHGINQAIKNLKGFNVYNLGESNTVTLSELVNTLEEIIGKPAILNQLPKQDGDVELTFADISKATNEIDYKPTVHIKDGLKSFVEWYRSQGV